jgi:hypothetical protein
MASPYPQNNVLGMDALEVYDDLSDPLIDNDIGLSSSHLNAHGSNYGARQLRKYGLLRVVTWSSLGRRSKQCPCSVLLGLPFFKSRRLLCTPNDRLHKRIRRRVEVETR